MQRSRSRRADRRDVSARRTNRFSKLVYRRSLPVVPFDTRPEDSPVFVEHEDRGIWDTVFLTSAVSRISEPPGVDCSRAFVLKEGVRKISIAIGRNLSGHLSLQVRCFHADGVEVEIGKFVVQLAEASQLAATVRSPMAAIEDEYSRSIGDDRREPNEMAVRIVELEIRRDLASPGARPICFCGHARRSLGRGRFTGWCFAGWLGGTWSENHHGDETKSAEGETGSFAATRSRSLHASVPPMTPPMTGSTMPVM